jgi:hypothetical protein
VDYTHAKKPVGGFIFITVTQLCLIWGAYRERLIRLKDLRVWFAAQELVARRCTQKAGARATYTLQELQKLTGSQGGERGSICRLERLGLLHWSTSSIDFASTIEELSITDASRIETMLSTITHVSRRVPVPRQVVRFIASPCRRCVIATVLGHLIRCLYYRFEVKQCISGGFCKASWIAEVFGVDLRNVKAARKFLADELGWLEVITVPQQLLNRYGQKTVINLSWTGRAMDKSDGAPSDLPPPPPELPPQLPPLKEHTEPLWECKHQEPASGPSGIWKTAKEGKPSLRHIVPEDLHDTGRLLRLFDEANKGGFIGRSESERLTFVALAERARVVGSTNPPGLFAQLLRRRLFHFVTQDDEEHALKRLRAHIYGDRPSLKPIALASPELSKDAHFVAVIQAKFSRAGFHGEMFSLVKAELPEWTKERWERAINEVEQARKQRTEKAMSRVFDGVSTNRVTR